MNESSDANMRSSSIKQSWNKVVRIGRVIYCVFFLIDSLTTQLLAYANTAPTALRNV